MALYRLLLTFFTTTLLIPSVIPVDIFKSYAIGFTQEGVGNPHRDLHQYSPWCLLSPYHAQ